jgi:predicted nucleotidyltransferase
VSTGDPIAPEVRRRIEAAMTALEKSEDARILIAVESGSRAWGFPSPDSDYDTRFIYLRPLDWYLSIESGRDVIEQPISDEVDIFGWDLKKTLGLILRSNAVALEWLRSPVIYRDHPELRADLTAFCAKALRRKPLTYHYLRLGANQYNRCMTPAGRAKIKMFFYALRPALMLRWLRLAEGSPVPPMDIQTLLAEADPPPGVVAFSEALIARKRETRELGEFVPEGNLTGFIAAEFAEASRWLETTPSELRASLTESADALFRKWVRSTG